MQAASSGVIAAAAIKADLTAEDTDRAVAAASGSGSVRGASPPRPRPRPTPTDRSPFLHGPRRNVHRAVTGRTTMLAGVFDGGAWEWVTEDAGA